jgi:hypothetical protein
MPGFLVVQQREYRQHQIELIDRGKACAVIVRPPPSKGGAWEVPREGAAVTMAEMLSRAKARIDAVMGPPPPRPSQRRQHGTRPDR